MAKDTSKVIPLGPCAISFNSIDLGHSDESTKVTFKEQAIGAMVAAYGKSIVKYIKNGLEVEVDFVLMQSDLANVQGSGIFPWFTKVTNAGATKLTFGEKAGKTITPATLIFTPDLAANTPGFNFTLTQAVPIGQPDLLYDGGKFQGWKCKVAGLIDEGKTDGGYIGTIGDTTITTDAVLPVVSTVVPADNASGIADALSSVVWTLSKVLNVNTVTKYTVKLFALPAGAAVTEVLCSAPVLVNNGASTTITLGISVTLAATTKYLAVLTNEIQDQAGNALAFYATQFTTV